MDGFVFVDKPKGLTSQDVCLRLKRKFNSKCGHNGTLDPNTTGVLVVAVGKACKLLKLINEHDKKYQAKIVFGYDSTTLDVDGEITQNIDMSVNLDELKSKNYNYLSNARHIALVKEAVSAVENGIESAENGLPFEMISVDINEAYDLLGEIIGAVYKDELLDTLFSKFCLGK